MVLLTIKIVLKLCGWDMSVQLLQRAVCVFTHLGLLRTKCLRVAENNRDFQGIICFRNKPKMWDFPHHCGKADTYGIGGPANYQLTLYINRVVQNRRM